MISANIPTSTRKAIYRRDGYRCALCDSTQYLQIHHIIPRRSAMSAARSAPGRSIFVTNTNTGTR